MDLDNIVEETQSISPEILEKASKEEDVFFGAKEDRFKKDTKEIEYWQEVRNEIDKINNL